jgi:ABC-2 type transport system ATP-binding protein
VSAGERDKREFTVRFDRFDRKAVQVITALQSLGEVADVRLDEPAIEDVIRRVYAGDLLLTRDPA